MIIFLAGSGLKRTYLFLSTKTLSNLPDAVFLVIGKSSAVFLVFLYLHDFLSGYITNFYCFGFLLFCRYQTFTKCYFIIWVLNITFTTLNFIECPFITKINIFLISFLSYKIFASIVQSDFYMVLWGWVVPVNRKSYVVPIFHCII